MRSRILLAAALAVALLASTSPVSAAPAQGSQRYIVRLARGVDPRAEAARLAAAGHQVKFLYTEVFPGFALDLPAPAAAALAARPGVVAVEQDAEVRALDTQTSPTWGLDRTDQPNLPLSGSFTYPANPGSGVTAYIIDTGINATHTEFTGRTDAGYTAIADGNGTNDCNGHGTHVAGTVAGTTYGLAKSARITPVRVLDCAGSGSWSGVIAGLDWVATNHQAGVPAVANMSLGGGANSSVDTAVANLVADGVTVAVAAGNSNLDACTTSPARVSSALTVGATDRTDTRASFSNFGTCLDLFAPGVSITSAWTGSTSSTNTISGTSMASPHVAGAAAVYLGINPTSSPAAVSSALLASTTKGVVLNPGTGSANQMLYLDPTWTTTPVDTPTAPAPATNVTAKLSSKTKRGATIAVSWTQGATSTPLTGQTLWAYRNGARYKSFALAGSTTSVSVSNLPLGATYAFSVIATSSAGSSPESALSNAVAV